MDFRNQKVTAPLKQVAYPRALDLAVNFRNQKVTAPLKLLGKYTGLSTDIKISVTKKLRPH